MNLNKPTKKRKPTIRVVKENLNPKRFSGKRVSQSSEKREAIMKRERRLQQYGHSVVEFNS